MKDVSACSFCGNYDDDNAPVTQFLIIAPHGRAAICQECVSVCVSLIHEASLQSLSAESPVMAEVCDGKPSQPGSQPAPRNESRPLKSLVASAKTTLPHKRSKTLELGERAGRASLSRK